MLLRSIRSQLLGLVVATVVPFTALIGVGLWSQWRSDQAAAIRARAQRCAAAGGPGRRLYRQPRKPVDRIEPGGIAGPGRRKAQTTHCCNRCAANCPDSSATSCCSRSTATSIGTSAEGFNPMSRDRDYFRQILAGQRVAISEVIRGRMSGTMGGHHRPPGRGCARADCGRSSRSEPSSRISRTHSGCEGFPQAAS